MLLYIPVIVELWDILSESSNAGDFFGLEVKVGMKVKVRVLSESVMNKGLSENESFT